MQTPQRHRSQPHGGSFSPSAPAWLAPLNRSPGPSRRAARRAAAAAEALGRRHSSREFATTALPEQVLSDLLWAAFGVNRPESGMRTAPSAVNWQEISVLVALPDGVWTFDAVRQRLTPVLNADIRGDIGLQPYVRQAPVCLLYVADLSRMTRASDEDKAFYSACDVGFISQNVYLFCAAEGLNTCVVGLVKRKAVAERLQLRPDQRILLVQPVGYPPPPGDAGAAPQ